MNRIFKAFSFVACLALVSATPVFTQTPSVEATPEATAAALVAHVYVQTTNGVNVFDATSAGKLTLVKGSPFSTTGQYALSDSTSQLFVYTITPTGIDEAPSR
jgi:hypothetical protein